MAVVHELDQDAWEDWVSTRPAVIQALCRRLPPDRLYLLKSSGHRVTLHSYSDDGTVTVDVAGEYNQVMFERRVFGISPDNLEECDLPGDSESLGAVLTEDDETEQYLDFLRVECDTDD